MLSLIPTALAATEEVAPTAVETGFFDFAALAGKIILAVGMIVGVFIVALIMKRSVEKMIQKKQGESHKELVILYGRISFMSVMIAGVLMALMITGMPLEMFSGALGLGLAFALKSPVANFIAGIVLLTQNKYNLGDFISVDNAKGTIVDITSRAASLRAIDGSEVTIPNLDLLTKPVTCYTRNPIRRLEVSVGVGYGTNLKQASELIKNIIATKEGISPEPAPAVIIDEIADSAITLKCRFWVDSRSQWVHTKSEMTREIFDAIKTAGIDIPYPVQTLRVDSASSDILAGEDHLLQKLKTIETKKTEKIFEKVPAETIG